MQTINSKPKHKHKTQTKQTKKNKNIRDEMLEGLAELKENIDYLNTALDTYEDVTTYNSTALNSAIAVVSALPGADSAVSSIASITGAASLISTLQNDADSVVSSIEYAVELLESLYSFGSAFCDGLIVGMICASITGIWAIIMIRKAYYKRYLNLRHNAPEFRFDESKFQLFWTSRFVGTVGSYLIVGPLLTIWFIALIVAILGWSSFHEFMEAYWFYFFYAPLLWLFEVFVIRTCINKKMAYYATVSDEEAEEAAEKDGIAKRKVLRLKKATLWLWWCMFNDVLFFPVSLLAALFRYLFLQFILLASYMRYVCMYVLLYVMDVCDVCVFWFRICFGC